MLTAVCLIGGPGSSKSSQAKRLEDRFAFLRIRSSEVLDAEGLRDPASPALVDDAIVIPAMARHLKSVHKDQDIVLDGFPRSTDQVDFVFNYCERLNLEQFDVRLVFAVIETNDAWAIRLNSIRWDNTDPALRRPDDKPEVFADRLRRSNVYLPVVVERIRQHDPESILMISGTTLTVSGVHAEIVTAIRTWKTVNQ